MTGKCTKPMRSCSPSVLLNHASPGPYVRETAKSLSRSEPQIKRASSSVGLNRTCVLQADRIIDGSPPSSMDASAIEMMA